MRGLRQFLRGDGVRIMTKTFMDIGAHVHEVFSVCSWTGYRGYNGEKGVSLTHRV